MTPEEMIALLDLRAKRHFASMDDADLVQLAVSFMTPGETFVAAAKAGKESFEALVSDAAWLAAMTVGREIARRGIIQWTDPLGR